MTEVETQLPIPSASAAREARARVKLALGGLQSPLSIGTSGQGVACGVRTRGLRLGKAAFDQPNSCDMDRVTGIEPADICLEGSELAVEVTPGQSPNWESNPAAVHTKDRVILCSGKRAPNRSRTGQVLSTKQRTSPEAGASVLTEGVEPPEDRV